MKAYRSEAKYPDELRKSLGLPADFMQSPEGFHHLQPERYQRETAF